MIPYICRNMGDSGEIQFYELDHESKIRLLKPHSHNSNRLAMEPGTREPYLNTSMHETIIGISQVRDWYIPGEGLSYVLECGLLS